MARVPGSGGGAVALAAALVAGLLVGFEARAGGSEEERRIGETVAEREVYVDTLAVFDAKQIALGRLAMRQSQDPQVRRFARQLVEEHRKHLKDLRAWADSEALEVASIELSSPQEGTGGAGSAGVEEGYEERKADLDERVDEAASEAQEDLNALSEKEGGDFDKEFLSRVLEDQEHGQKLVSKGLDTYRSDVTFGLLLNRTNNQIDRNVKRGESLQRVID